MSQPDVQTLKTSPPPTLQSQTPALRRASTFMERRWEPRYPTNDPADVKVLPAGTIKASGFVLDVSRFGLRLELPIALQKGAEVKVAMQLDVVILGQVRYCRGVEDVFQAGISIRDVVYSSEEQEQHVHDDRLGLYAGGKGLTVPEVLKLKDHMIRCAACRIRLGDFLDTRKR